MCSRMPLALLIVTAVLGRHAADARAAGLGHLQEAGRLARSVEATARAAEAISDLVISATGNVASKGGPTQECPGQSGRYQDNRCAYDKTHRVCAQLIDASNQPINFAGRGTFWEITGQRPWVDTMVNEPNSGDSWCICMWATNDLIKAAGCENVNIRCAETDLDEVMRKYEDRGVALDEAKQCLRSKCPGAAALSPAALPAAALPTAVQPSAVQPAAVQPSAAVPSAAVPGGPLPQIGRTVPTVLSVPGVTGSIAVTRSALVTVLIATLMQW